MPQSEATEDVAIIVKAVPQPSKKYGETVCCAGITREGEWRGLYPIRFRRLRDNSFVRWQWVRCKTARRSTDRRVESRRVAEDSIEPLGMIKPSERPRFIEPLIRDSVMSAANDGCSLALLRPTDVQFYWSRRKAAEIEAEQQAYQLAARQHDLFDADLASLEPCPFPFRMKFDDASGSHDHQCQDWETEAAFWNIRRSHGEEAALKHLDQEYNQRRPTQGLVPAMATWLPVPRRGCSWASCPWQRRSLTCLRSHSSFSGPVATSVAHG
jgi:hypothetical protein